MKQQPVSWSLQWNETRISSSLRIEYTIIQDPLGGLSSQRLTAAVSNCGGLPVHSDRNSSSQPSVLLQKAENGCATRFLYVREPLT